MDRTKRIVFFAAIIVIAGLVAMHFWRSSAPTGTAVAILPSSGRNSTTLEAPILQPAIEPALVVPQESPANFHQAGLSPAFSPQLGENAAIIDPRRLPSDPAPERPVGFSEEPTSTAGSLNAPPATSGDILFGGLSPAEPGQGRRHRIVDGDTLPLLAARYLGSADRAEEIFEANRDVLSQPDLLPLGRMIVIPAN